MTEQNQNPQEEQTTDYYSWFKETVRFNDEELSEEIQLQTARLKAENQEEGNAFSVAMESEENQWKVKKAITEVAIVFSAAFAIPEDKEWASFAEKMLAQSENEEKFASKIRSHLLLQEPNEARDQVRQIIESEVEDPKAKRAVKMRYDIRLDDFVDKYRKQQKA